MTPFNCPTCGSKTWKLIAPRKESGLDKLACPKCYSCVVPSPTYLHQLAEGSDNRNLTQVKARIIENRIIRKEDGLVIDRRTGKETQY